MLNTCNEHKISQPEFKRTIAHSVTRTLVYKKGNDCYLAYQAKLEGEPIYRHWPAAYLSVPMTARPVICHSSLLSSSIYIFGNILAHKSA